VEWVSLSWSLYTTMLLRLFSRSLASAASVFVSFSVDLTVSISLLIIIDSKLLVAS